MKIKSLEVHYRVLSSASQRDFREYSKAPRVYVWPEGETILDNLANRKTRPYNEFRKLVEQPALAALGLDSKTHRLAWSQYAGCSCPCSPGFIVKSRDGHDYRSSKKVDLHCTVVDDGSAQLLVEAPATNADELAEQMKKAGAL